ncbi:MAG: CbrC family protein [Bacteroidetes bacterium]|nr:CbrC family protein [Bacteroidota bacterium]
MAFKYFEDPEEIIGLSDELITCDFCNKEKKCFDGSSFFGEDSFENICPECLKGGKLNTLDIFSCSGDIEELKLQLKSLQPELSAQEINSIAEKKTKELEKETPHLITWQDWLWPVSNGDYCKFIGYGSKSLYNKLAIKSSGEVLFKGSIYKDLKEDSDVEYLWDEVLPQDEINNYEESSEYDTVFYVFKSLTSKNIITIWDSN